MIWNYYYIVHMYNTNAIHQNIRKVIGLKKISISDAICTFLVLAIF